VGPSFIKNTRSDVVTVPVLIANERENRPKDRAAFDELETFLKKHGIWASNDVDSKKRDLKEGEYR
jgi:carbamoylphosphate synthase small subunit